MGIYITRWSAKRLREIANTVKEKKRDVISKSSFGDLLHISPLPPPPEALVDFIVMRIDTKKRLLKLSDHKKIQLTRDMVKKLFNVPSGSKPLEFGKRGKADFREIYLEGERAPIPTTVIYMDHIDIPRGCIVDHTIDYSLPRACFVKELDFTVVIAVDTIEDGFGKRPFSSTSPYATTKFMSYIEQLAKLPNKASMSATEIPDMDVPQVESPPRSPAVDIESFMEIRARSPLFDNLFAAAASPGPVYDVTPLATFPPISTGPAETCIDDTIEEAQRYCCTNYKIKDPPRGEPLPSFIRIGGFDISFKHFSNGLKKRAHVNNEVMSLYIESFNIEHIYSSSKPRKFAFSPHVASKLYVDPSSFNTNSCTKDLKRACEKNDIAKADQLFFTIVKQDHWAVVVLNLIHKQFNVFDSNIRDSDYVSFLEKPCSNLIENFKTLVRGRNPWKHNLDMFERFTISYPQSTTFDCGLFAIVYMENLTARGLKPFNTDTTSLLNFRKYIAAKLFKHPQNTLSSEEELEKLLKKS
ncbi:hypothetical protein ZWY2020_005647 [Hordeum vulgare]|nr:hypothetical protein ZWY2020_005647 [Hordeum vulgare]